MHRSHGLQGSLKRRRKHPHPTSINGYHTVKNGLGTIVSKRPTFAFMGKSGYTHRLCSKNRIQALTQRNKGSPPLAAAWLCAASEIVTERTAGGSGCTPHGVCPLPPASRPRWAAQPERCRFRSRECFSLAVFVLTVSSPDPAAVPVPLGAAVRSRGDSCRSAVDSIPPSSAAEHPARLR